MTQGGFSDKVALITGGAGAIGQAVASALMARGAKVGVLDHVHPELATVFVAGDVTKEADVREAVSTLADELGPIRMLVCAAGVVSEYPIERLDPDEWHRIVDVSMTGTYLATRAVVPHMRDHGGSILAFSSGYASTGYPRGAHYAAAKAGIEALVKSLAQEVAPAIRVNAIAPGPVLTPMLGHIENREAWRRDREERIPLGRIAEPEDLVGPTLFLLGRDSAYVTGQVLHVNGGLLMP